jgi:threonine aldolase
MVRDLADYNKLPLHLDGERIFNASVALGVSINELVKDFDSVMFGLSKGLACPIGSIICGSSEIISKARFQRKLLGGGMRQSGIIAAAGIVALEEMIDRLSEDHDNAKLLSQGLSRIPGIEINPEIVQTNIVFFDINIDIFSRREFVTQSANLGVKILELDKRLRAVTHFGIIRNDIIEALQIFEHVVANG